MNYYSANPCEQLFLESGPFFHLCTTPLESEVFFHADEERKLAVNLMAICVTESGVRLLAFAIMSNHYHFVLEGDKITVMSFWSLYQELLSSYFNRHRRSGLMARVQAGLYVISSLKQLRNTIAYVIRNGYAARQDVHVFADPWSSGCLYFNPLIRKDGVPAASLKGQALRDFSRSRPRTELSPNIYVRDGMAQIWSFVEYQRVEMFYDNARQFINCVLKNVEGIIEVSMSMNESTALSDEELLPVVFRLCRERLHAEGLSQLDLPSRKRLALILKQEYHSGNKQIARLTRLSLREVDEMFPLSKVSRA